MTARARIALKIPPLVCLLATCALAQELDERQVLQLFRESPYYRELQAGVEIVRVEARREGIYPNPSVSAAFEGAGRTDFFVLEQELMLNGRRSLLRRAGNSTVRVAETSAEHALRQGEARVRRAFYQLIYAQMRKEAIAVSISELEVLVRSLREREEAGEGSKFDRLRAEREVAERRIESAEIEAVIAEVRATLAGLLGGAGNPDALAVQGSLEAGFNLPALSQSLADGLSARSDYKVEAERLEQLRHEAEAADRLRIPNPVVAGGLKRAEVGDRYLNGPVISVSIDLPLFDKGQVDKALAEAKADRARAQRRVLESQILADVRAAHDSLRLRRQIAAAYRMESGTLAREVLEIARAAYREGELGILELLDALGVAHQAKLRQLELQAAAKMAEVEFDRSVAKEMLQ